MAFTYFFGHWTLDASKIAGIAMSTTSVAVVYAVMVESGLAGEEFGELILAACFFTDLGAVVALGLLFATIIVGLRHRGGDRRRHHDRSKVSASRDRSYAALVSEPTLRVVFGVIFLLAALATYAKSEGILPHTFGSRMRRTDDGVPGR